MVRLGIRRVLEKQLLCATQLVLVPCGSVLTEFSTDTIQRAVTLDPDTLSSSSGTPAFAPRTWERLLILQNRRER